MKTRSLFSVSFLACVATAASVHAVEVADYTTPNINPQRDCLTEGMINPANKEYRFLFSRDCRVVHVLPPPVMAQNIKPQGVNLQACGGLKSSRDSIATQEAKLADAEVRLLNYERAIEKASSKSEERRLTAKIKDLTERLTGYRKVLEESQAALDKHYGSTPGAEFSILMGGNISPTELNELRGLNLANLSRKKIIVEKTIGPDGKENVKTTEVREESALRPAAIGNSYYSFVYNVPKDAIANGGVISSDIPNLQYLGQKDASYSGVIHVKSNGGISGKVVLALTLACDHTGKDPEGNLVLKEETDPFFTVNRTFEVQQMFSQGYVASLNVDKVVSQISKFTVNHTEQGFKKSSVFTPVINANVDELINFEWTTEFDTGKAASFEQISAIKTSVAEKLVDDYLENLEKEQLITKKADPVVDPVQGGYIDESRMGHRCWTEKDGGLSGLVGRRHEVCGDFTYVVKVWKDGVTEEDINRSLTLHGSTTDIMKINTVTPFYFTTAFVKNPSER